MSEFNFDEPEPKPSGFSAPAIGMWDIFTIIVLLITVCLGVYFVMVFLNPGSSLNPLKPASFRTPTATITPLQMEPTWTPTPTVFLSPTATLLPSITPPATTTPANLVPATDTPVPTVTPTFTPTPKAPFSAASVNAIESVLIPHLANASCNWQGVGGTVDDQNSSPIIGIVVRLAGKLDGKTIELTTVSGVSPEYGKSGFEFVLGETPVDSRDTLYVQLLDQAGLPLSDQIYIDTFSDCEKNLVLVRFKKNR
ncbi:MAG: hypothetical protein JW963_20110 [Anaerolineales bacterium]|nr:hypothetical protein [Anaerolineales bacterium]